MLNPNVVNAFRSVYAKKEYDKWGNLQTAPSEIIEERHHDNFIKIFIHKFNDNFIYGYQIKIETLVEQKTANINGAGCSSADAARQAAAFEIEKICTAHRTAKKAFADFTRIRYNQPELFAEDMYERRYQNDN